MSRNDLSSNAQLIILEYLRSFCVILKFCFTKNTFNVTMNTVLLTRRQINCTLLQNSKPMLYHINMRGQIYFMCGRLFFNCFRCMICFPLVFWHTFITSAKEVLKSRPFVLLSIHLSVRPFVSRITLILVIPLF